MASRASTHETTVLMLTMLKHIPRTARVTASQLQHLVFEETGIERDIRTIQRMLNTLVEHFDIECDDRNKPHGYRWKAHSKGFSLPTLNEQESLLLALAEQHLRNLLPPSLMASMADFFHQARLNLQADDEKPQSGWLAKVQVVDVSQPLLPPKIDQKVLQAVSQALFENKWLTVHYQNAQDMRTTSFIQPLGLAQQGPRLYLVCRFKGYDNERSLALHRIQKAEMSNIGFERPKGFDLRKYDEDGRFGFGEGRHIVLSFNIDKTMGKHLLETPLSKDQQIETHGSHYSITATVIDAHRLDWWLRGFGDKAWGITKVPVAPALGIKKISREKLDSPN